MRLEFVHPDATDQERQHAQAAALAVFRDANVDPRRAYIASVELADQGDLRGGGDYRKSQEGQLALKLLGEAEEAANAAMRAIGKRHPAGHLAFVCA